MNELLERVYNQLYDLEQFFGRETLRYIQDNRVSDAFLNIVREGNIDLFDIVTKSVPFDVLTSGISPEEFARDAALLDNMDLIEYLKNNGVDIPHIDRKTVKEETVADKLTNAAIHGRTARLDKLLERLSKEDVEESLLDLAGMDGVLDSIDYIFNRSDATPEPLVAVALNTGNTALYDYLDTAFHERTRSFTESYRPENMANFAHAIQNIQDAGKFLLELGISEGERLIQLRDFLDLMS